MKWLNFAFGIFLCAQGSVCRLTAADTILSPPDQAVASPEYRLNLIEEYKKAPSTFTDDRLLAVAISCALVSNYDLSAQLYNKFLQVHPDNTRGLRGRGLVYFLQGHYLEAIPYFQKAWGFRDPQSLQNLASCYIETKQYDKVEALLPELRQNIAIKGVAKCILILAVRKDPFDQQLFMEALNAKPIRGYLAEDDALAIVIAEGVTHIYDKYGTNRTVRLACEKMTQEYRANPSDWPSNHIAMIGDAYAMLGNTEAARSIYEEVLATRPNDSIVLSGLARSCLLNHQYAEAIQLLQKAYSLGDKGALADLALTYVATDNFAAARQLIPKLLAQKQEDMRSLQALLAYALLQKPADKLLFYQALEGYSDEQLLRRADTTDTVLKGFTVFDDEERFQKLQQAKNRETEH